MQSVESASALLGLDAAPLVLLELHSHSWTESCNLLFIWFCLAKLLFLFECDGFIRMQLTKIPFCDFKRFGVVKFARFGVVMSEVFKNKYFC